jgi:hypothetical protein
MHLKQKGTRRYVVLLMSTTRILYYEQNWSVVLARNLQTIAHWMLQEKFGGCYMKGMDTLRQNSMHLK